jgi:hypothetical protein
MFAPVTITRTSPFTGKTKELTVNIDIDDYERYLDGELVQNAFPYLTADEREFILSGIYPGEWELAFPEQEE